jgi:hypothetical protein
MTKDERNHMDAVAGLGCILCHRMGHDDTPAVVHHIRAGQGMGQRASHYETIPLCPEHHAGKTGLHGMGVRAFERVHGVTEYELLAEVRELLGVEA